MSMTVYVVEGNWEIQYTSPDNWYNCSEHSIDGVFSTKEKAIEFIRNKLLDKLEDPEYLTYSKDNFPQDEKLDGFIYRDGSWGIYWFDIEAWEVDEISTNKS